MFKTIVKYCMNSSSNSILKLKCVTQPSEEHMSNI